MPDRCNVMDQNRLGAVSHPRPASVSTRGDHESRRSINHCIRRRPKVTRRQYHPPSVKPENAKVKRWKWNRKRAVRAEKPARRSITVRSRLLPQQRGATSAASPSNNLCRHTLHAHRKNASPSKRHVRPSDTKETKLPHSRICEITPPW